MHIQEQSTIPVVRSAVTRGSDSSIDSTIGGIRTILEKASICSPESLSKVLEEIEDLIEFFGCDAYSEGWEDGIMNLD